LHFAFLSVLHQVHTAGSPRIHYIKMGSLTSRCFHDSPEEALVKSLESDPDKSTQDAPANGCPFLAATKAINTLSTSDAGSPVIDGQHIITTKHRQMTAKEVAGHPLLPQRDGVDEKEFGGKITWRHGKAGDYSKANIKYLNERIGRWDSPECLENVVSNLIKTLEMELTKKSDPKQWVSMAPEVFRYRANANKWVETEEAVEKGSYNILMKGADKALYDTAQGFDESHETFHKAFPNGFALEVLKVYGGPPEVGFTWRHWGTFEGEYNGLEGDGREINIFGFGRAKVRMPSDKDHRIRFTEVEVFYDIDKFLAELNMKDVEHEKVDASMGGTVVKCKN